MQFRLSTFAPIGLAFGLAGCAASDSVSAAATADAAPPEAGVDETIQSQAARYKAFTRMNIAAFQTQQHAGGAMVNVYVNAVALDSYRTIIPVQMPASTFEFPVGSMVVKEMLEASGTVLTVMYKREQGYDPNNKNWWYGRLSPDGVPTNRAFVGRVDFCVACHAGAAKTDYVWGIPTANLVKP
jgi:hypothetical protein